MSTLKIKAVAVLALVLTGVQSSLAQQVNSAQNIHRAGSAQGELTVTLTVVSSVGVVTGPDGQQRVVVANAAAASDNVSSLQFVRLTDVNAGPGSQANGNPAHKPHRK